MTRRLPFYTVMHFLVDLACIFRLFSLVRPQAAGREQWTLLVVLYNFLAFALPALVGLIADLLGRNHYLSAAGCVLIAAAGSIRTPVEIPVILLGIGNGLFHVGAGRQVLADAGRRAAPSGIFICSGALGLFLGTALGPRMLHPLDHILTASAAVSAAVLILWGIRDGKRPAGLKETAGPERSAPSFRTFLTVQALLVFAVVFLRSFYGHAVHYDWNDGFRTGLIFTLCIVAGKGLGGIAADRIGIRMTTVLSLAGAALTVLFSADHMLWGCVSILLFNMTMPLTLTLLASCWREWPGFAFGTLMLALFLGSVPAVLAENAALPPLRLCLVSLASLLLLLAALGRPAEKRTDRDAA